MCVNLVVLHKLCEKLRCFLEKFTQLAQILHERRSWRSRQISTLCPSQFPLLSINLKSHNILDQCAGAIQAQCGEPVEGGSSYRPLRRTGDELNFWSWIDDDNDNYGNISKPFTILSRWTWTSSPAWTYDLSRQRLSKAFKIINICRSSYQCHCEEWFYNCVILCRIYSKFKF